MNKVILKGRLTRDPEVRFSSGGEPVCILRFSLACEDRERAKDEDGKYPANFIPCVFLGKRAESASAYLCQGKELLVCGKMQSGSYTNKEGRKVYTLECLVNEVEYCGKKSDDLSSQEPDYSFMDNLSDEDLPFK